MLPFRNDCWVLFGVAFLLLFHMSFVFLSCLEVHVCCDFVKFTAFFPRQGLGLGALFVQAPGGLGDWGKVDSIWPAGFVASCDV